MAGNSPVLTGRKEIADFCGVTIERVDKWLADHPDFPATREGKNGGWITTKEAVSEWLTQRVKAPRPPRTPRPLRQAHRGFGASTASGGGR